MSGGRHTGGATLAWTVALLAGAGVAATAWAYFVTSDAFIASPDYWGLRHLGERVSVADPATWRNGFYPWATVLLYGAYSALDVGAGGATAVAALAMGVSGVALGGVGACRRSVVAAGSGGVALVALPGWLENASVPTTDILACAWVALGVAATATGGRTTGADGRTEARSSTTRSSRVLAAALCLGASTAFRFHTIAFALPFVFACGLLRVWSRRATLVAAAILAVFGAVPGLVNVADGRAFGDSAQLLNLYKTLRPALWTSLHPEDLEGLTAFGLLTDDPGATVRAWWRWVLPQAPLVAFSAVAWAAFRREAAGRLLAALALGALVCAAATALGSSDRAVLLTGLVAVASGVVALVGSEPGPRRFAWSLVCTLAVAGCAWTTRAALAEDHAFRARVAAYAAQVEAVSMELGITRSNQAFTNEVLLYFPTMAPGPLVQNGGWGGFDLPGWRDAYPELCTRDLDCLHESAIAGGVCLLWLSPAAVTLGPAFGPLVDATSPVGPFRPVGQLGPARVFVVDGACAAR